MKTAPFKRFLVHLMSGLTLHVDAKDKGDAAAGAIVWHQHTDAIELIEEGNLKSPVRSRHRRVVKVTKRS